MSGVEQLRLAIDEQQRRLGASVPTDREAALLALIRAQDAVWERTPFATGEINEPVPDLITGRRLDDLGGTRALQICLEAPDGGRADPTTGIGGWDAWAASFRRACEQVAAAELVLGHCETGFMRLAITEGGWFEAWIATRRAPAAWRERADIDWWAAWLARRDVPGAPAGSPLPDGGPGDERRYQALADHALSLMSYQLGYPLTAAIGGCTVEDYRAVLGRLIAWALRARDRGEEAVALSEAALVIRLAAALNRDPAIAGQALAGFTLDRDRAADHAGVPGVAAPLVRMGPDRIAWSLLGLTTEPFFFLIRELKARDGSAYHNTAAQREDVFRQDLYALFADKRFVTSRDRIALRRGDGNVRTDIDAVVFDRKRGALACFELKSQDPFAGSAAELARQGDNFRYANRQIAGTLDWLKRHGADALLERVDRRVAKTFRAQKVYPFVLGRYLAHVDGGPAPDRRAAWGTWPQVLRLLDGQPVRATEGNPLASLFTRLGQDDPNVRLPPEMPPRHLDLGSTRLIVYPSYASVQASAGGDPNVARE
jgi:hypothetical protein